MQGVYNFIYELVNWTVNLDLGSQLAITALILAVTGLGFGMLSFMGGGGD